MWTDRICLRVHWWSIMQNMLHKLLSEAHVQWAQTLSWYQVPVHCSPWWFVWQLYMALWMETGMTYFSFQLVVPWTSFRLYARFTINNSLLLVWWTSNPSINLYLWRIQEPFIWFYPCTFKYYHIKHLWGGGMGICWHYISVVFPRFRTGMKII